MEPHQQRVIVEKKELDGRFAKLAAFIGSIKFDYLPPAEKDRLERQMLIMKLYGQVLKERIDAFPKPEPSPQNDFRE